MKYLKALLGFLWTWLQALLYRWLLSLIDLVRLLCAQVARWCARRRWPERLRKASPQRCTRISDPAFKRPDPMIYAQFYLLAQGLAITWDNPDIELRRAGVAVPSHALLPDTDYEVVARIWNNSTEAPVVDLPVRLSYLSFGIGTQSHPIGGTKVNLGVKGGPNHPAFASVPWRTPAAGHYCLQVWLEWLDDANPHNNLGQENTFVGMLHSPAEVRFQLRNDTAERQTYGFEVDAYALPPPSPCTQRPQPKPASRLPERLAPGTVATVPPQHQRQNHPLPAGWTVAFAPAQPTLAAGEEITVQLTATAPEGFHGRQPLNVHAFHQGGLAGGVTVYVELGA